MPQSDVKWNLEIIVSTPQSDVEWNLEIVSMPLSDVEWNLEIIVLTPKSLFDDLLKQLFTLVRWVRFSEYEKTSLSNVCDTQYPQSVANNNEWSMQSNAFEMTVKSAPNALPLSTASLIFLSSLQGNVEQYVLFEIRTGSKTT